MACGYTSTSYILLLMLFIATFWGWAFWKWPMQTFAWFPFVLPLYLVRTKIGPLPTTSLELIILATVVVWIVKEARGKGRGAKSLQQFFKRTWNELRGWHIPIGLWLLAGLIGIFVAADHLGALGLYRAYFIEPVLIFIIGLDLLARNQTHATMQQCNNATFLPSLLASRLSLLLILLGLYVIVQFLTGWGIPYPWHEWAGRRAVGPFPYPNALSLFIAPVVVLLFGILLKNRTRQGHDATMRAHQGRAATILGIIFGIVAIGLAKSDGGFIAVCAGIFVACLFYKRMRWIAASFAIIGLIAIAAIAPIRTKVLHVVEFKEWSGMVRTVIWKESVAMLKDHPIFGAGLGGYPDAIKPYHKATWMEIFQYPHNIVLNLWSETGLLGIIAFGWILGRWVWGMGVRNEHHAPSTTRYALVIPIITALLVHGLVDVPYFKNDLAVMFWVLILITIMIDSPDKQTHS